MSITPSGLAAAGPESEAVKKIVGAQKAAKLMARMGVRPNAAAGPSPAMANQPPAQFAQTAPTQPNAYGPPMTVQGGG